MCIYTCVCIYERVSLEFYLSLQPYTNILTKLFSSLLRAT